MEPSMKVLASASVRPDRQYVIDDKYFDWICLEILPSETEMIEWIVESCGSV